jgi:hypothetical protein
MVQALSAAIINSRQEWMAEREPRMKEWRETFGIK